MSVKAMTWAFDQDVDSNSKFVLVALADHADDDGKCWPSYEHLARKTSMSRRTIIRKIQHLKDQGLINVEKRHDNSQQQSNIFWLQLGGGGSDTVSPGVVTECHPGSDTVSPKPSVNHHNETDRARTHGDFEEVSEKLQNKAFDVFGQSPYQLSKWAEYYEDSWIMLALEKTFAAGKNNPNYTNSILQNWAKEGPPKELTEGPEQKSRGLREYEEMKKNWGLA